MIRIECDNCDRVFEVKPDEADAAGGKVSCPFCGDVNRVPAPDAARPAQTTTDLPSADGPEREILAIHPAMFRAHPFRALAILALLAGGVVIAILPFTSEGVGRWIIWPGVVLALVAAGWWLTWYFSAYLWVKLRISNKRTVRNEGIVRRHTSEVLHDHVRNVEIRQNALQRIFNVGYLGISSSGQDGIEIEVRDVPKPYEIKALIDQYRDM